MVLTSRGLFLKQSQLSLTTHIICLRSNILCIVDASHSLRAEIVFIWFKHLELLVQDIAIAKPTKQLLGEEETLPLLCLI